MVILVDARILQICLNCQGMVRRWPPKPGPRPVDPSSTFFDRSSCTCEAAPLVERFSLLAEFDPGLGYEVGRVFLYEEFGSMPEGFQWGWDDGDDSVA